MQACYKIPFTATVDDRPNEVIGATMLIVDMINSSISQVDDGVTRDVPSVRTKILSIGKLMGTTFSTLDIKGRNPTVDDTVSVLGTCLRFQFSNFIHFV